MTIYANILIPLNSVLCLFLFCVFFFFFFFNDTATPEIYPLSLHDALPISRGRCPPIGYGYGRRRWMRSEEHTSELQSRSDLVCRLLLEKKKRQQTSDTHIHARRLLPLLHPRPLSL